MTMETLTLEERMAAMEAALAQARAENEALRNRADDPVAAQDSLNAAIKEFESQYATVVPGARMVTPCQMPKGAGICNRPWRAHLGEDGRPPIVRDHQYRDTPLPPPVEKPKGRMYHREEVAVDSVPAEVQDTYLTERDAAKALGTTVVKVRGMVKAGTLTADRIAGISLVRKAGVDRIVALAELEAHEGVQRG